MPAYQDKATHTKHNTDRRTGRGSVCPRPLTGIDPPASSERRAGLLSWSVDPMLFSYPRPAWEVLACHLRSLATCLPPTPPLPLTHDPGRLALGRVGADACRAILKRSETRKPGETGAEMGKRGRARVYARAHAKATHIRSAAGTTVDLRLAGSRFVSLLALSCPALPCPAPWISGDFLRRFSPACFRKDMVIWRRPQDWGGGKRKRYSTAAAYARCENRLSDSWAKCA